MDLSSLLSAEPSYDRFGNHAQMGSSEPQHHHYPTRHAISEQAQPTAKPTLQISAAPMTGSPLPSPTRANPKPVTFVLLLPETPQLRARLPMRVNINAHDNTESITTTVKNFYGLYDRGVSFEDNNGCTLIASYDNLERDMTVYVRVVSQPVDNLAGHTQTPHDSPRKPHLAEPFEMLPPKATRPDARTTRKPSASPQTPRDRRSPSANTQNKARPRSGAKRRGSSTHGSVADPNGDATNDYSSSDGGNESVSSSRKAKAEQLASAEISVDNIVEGGRRKRAKFESSELPLFAPPQVPMAASTSSISPQRRINSGNGASPFAFPNQHTFAYPQPLPSPQTRSNGDGGSYWQVQSGVGNWQPHSHRLRGQTSYGPPRVATSGKVGVPPTPDPTIGGSVISDEDAALQLMRLGDASCFSSHGRTSTSTADDALSGNAEIASSNSDEDTDEPCTGDISSQKTNAVPGRGNGKRQHAQDNLPSSTSVESSGEEYEDARDSSFNTNPASKDLLRRGPVQAKAKPRRMVPSNKQPSKPGVPSSKSKARAPQAGKAPISPTSLPPQSRKPSNASLLTFQSSVGGHDDDLSSKPRCQRCRKSKKGCDRQRPCQRCKDAGIGVEGCLSEDEGNGRKGRFGRHMGVAVAPVTPGKRESEGPLLKKGTIMANIVKAVESLNTMRKRKR